MELNIQQIRMWHVLQCLRMGAVGKSREFRNTTSDNIRAGNFLKRTVFHEVG
jgi:hypothetical protein